MLVLAMQFSRSWRAAPGQRRTPAREPASMLGAAHPENGRDDGRARFGRSRGNTCDRSVRS
jgi:hypothetical protein